MCGTTRCRTRAICHGSCCPLSRKHRHDEEILQQFNTLMIPHVAKLFSVDPPFFNAGSPQICNRTRIHTRAAVLACVQGAGARRKPDQDRPAARPQPDRNDRAPWASARGSRCTWWRSGSQSRTASRPTICSRGRRPLPIGRGAVQLGSAVPDQAGGTMQMPDVAQASSMRPYARRSTIQ